MWIGGSSRLDVNNVYPGQHDAIIDLELWQIVQDQLAASRRERSLAAGAEHSSLLAGLIFDSDGDGMTPTHAVKKGKRYRYYVSTALVTGSPSKHIKGRRVPAGDVEALVLDRLRVFFATGSDVADTLAWGSLDAHSLETALSKAAAVSEGWLTAPLIETRRLAREIVERVTLAADRIEIRLARAKVAAALHADLPGDLNNFEPLVLSVDVSPRRAGKGKRLIIGDNAPAEVDAGVVHLIAKAFAVRNQLLSGSEDSIETMTERLGAGKGWLTSLVRLSYLAPDIVRAMLAGRQPVELNPTRLMRLSKDLPPDWSEQRRFLGFVDR